MQTGTHVPGCIMGPDAFRSAGLEATLSTLGHEVADYGNVAIPSVDAKRHENAAVHHLAETAAWCTALESVAYDAVNDGAFPIFLGGDHSLSAGTLPGVTRAAAQAGRPQFVLWLDAHPDYHTLDTTGSGNLHGTPLAYCVGRSGFDGHYPKLHSKIQPERICMMGIRSVDPAEHDAISEDGPMVYDMRALDEVGIGRPLQAFLEQVAEAEGALHVSLDVDFLDPTIAPAVGTTVPGGTTFREAHLVMELLCDSGLVTSLDLVELNPFLDERGRTAKLMVDLCASLLGRKVLDRPTRSF